MLDIKDMNEVDRLFYFLEGLKPWAKQELQRQRVADLATAQAAAERLTDYTSENSQPKKTNPQTSANNAASKKSGKQWPSKSGGGDKRTPESSSSSKSDAATGKKPLKCWLCQGPHRAAACPHQSKLSAIKASIAQEEQGCGEDDED